MSWLPHGSGSDCCCGKPACPACAEMTPSHVEAAMAAAFAVSTALRDPEEDEIPRHERGSFVERLGSVVEMVLRVQLRAIERNDCSSGLALEMVVQKINAIASDMALAKAKEKPNA